MTMRVVFARSLDELEVNPDDLHFLRYALRAQESDQILCSDGIGRIRSATLRGECLVEAGAIRDADPRARTGIAVAMTAGDRPEWIVAKAAELGISDCVLFKADKSVSRFNVNTLHNERERLQRIARHHAMRVDCKWLPTLTFYESHGAVPLLAEPLMMDNSDDSDLSMARSKETPLRADQIFVPPVDGWSERERNRGIPLGRLNSQRVSTETAAMLAVALLAHFS